MCVCLFLVSLVPCTVWPMLTDGRISDVLTKMRMVLGNYMTKSSVLESLSIVFLGMLRHAFMGTKDAKSLTPNFAMPVKVSFLDPLVPAKCC